MSLKVTISQGNILVDYGGRYVLRSKDSSLPGPHLRRQRHIYWAGC